MNCRQTEPDHHSLRYSALPLIRRRQIALLIGVKVRGVLPFQAGHITPGHNKANGRDRQQLCSAAARGGISSSF
jgi:hypothetical protein